MGGTPVVSFDFRNQWSGDNHRTSLSIDASKFTSTFGAPPKTPARAQLAAIERLGDDRLILSSSSFTEGTNVRTATGLPNTYIDEPYSTLRGRLRFNLFEGLDPQLAGELPPELTPAQRQRLGRELRAALQPLTRRLSRQYFRALPNTRIINGLKCRGYRYTTLSNSAAFGRAMGTGSNAQWTRANAEWWLADEQPGDSEIRAFTTRANALKTAGGPVTVSMWLNEYLPVLWQAAPEETHAALASLIGNSTDSNFGFRGTPVQMFATVSLPPLQQLAVGDVRFALELKNRHQLPVDESVFQAPTGAKRQEIEPFLQITRNALKQARTQMESAMDGAMGSSAPAPTDTSTNY